ncbi:helix-hairpin-helix domain-containing protein [Streptomyces sp. NPDC018038]|uniref:helix-hairpin-helix domain-containing protein n=1 Tax=Streptomyces sp. NPDC018038 TaxID=3365036 RepID=UPI0037AA5F53
MTLRTRIASRTGIAARARVSSTTLGVLGAPGAPTGGPGRVPGSDGRSRPGARGAPSGRVRRRTRVRRVGTAPEALGRRRGDELFPPAAAPPGEPAAAEEEAEGPAYGEPGAPPGAAERGRPPGARARLAAVLRDRTPVWVRTRVGLEPRALGALTVVLVVAAALAGGYFWAGRPEPVRAPEVVRAAPVAAAPGFAAPGVPAAPAVPGTRAGPGAVAGVVPGSAGGGARVMVDVGGKVRRPGVLTLPAGSRVADALRAAGGAEPGADLTALNRARVLFDGEQVLVGVPGVPAGGSGGVVGGGAVGPGGGAGGGAGVPLSLNAATVEQLDTLPGVGPVLARHIVDHRAQHGGFRSVGELREVNGIGERRFAELERLVRP